jgi:hypothetical protein
VIGCCLICSCGAGEVAPLPPKIQFKFFFVLSDSAFYEHFRLVSYPKNPKIVLLTKFLAATAPFF